LNNFCYVDKVHDKYCVFKIDMSSNVSILNSNLIELNKPKIKINNYNLKYATGENIN